MAEYRRIEPYQEFMQFKIVQWNKDTEIVNPDINIYQLNDFNPIETFLNFRSDPNIGKIEGLAIGANVTDYVTRLISAKNKLKNLKRLIIGNKLIDGEEELDIVECRYPDSFTNKKRGYFKQNINLNRILSSFPSLELLILRGKISVTDGELEHQNLKILMIEGLGVSDKTLEDLFRVKLPLLSRLDIWIGTRYWRWGNRRDFDDEPDEMNKSIFAPLFSCQIYPKLIHLALIDADFTDEIAYEIAASDILKNLEVLDLSRGSLTDEGADILINSKYINHLKTLDLSGHYCSMRTVKNVREQAAKHKINLIMEDNDDDFFDGVQERYNIVRE